MMGLAQAGAFPAAAAAVSVWIPVNRRGIVNGLLGGFMSVGGAAGAFFTGLLLSSLSWRSIFLLFALPGLAWAIAFWFWFRNRPEQHPQVNRAESDFVRPSIALKPRLGALAKAPQPAGGRGAAIFALAALCAQQTFRGAGYVFFASWFATYLRETHQVTDLTAGVMNGLPLLAVVIGSPLGGLIVDLVLARTGSHRLSRQGVAIVASLVCSGLIVISLSVSNPWLAVLLISAGSFFASFGGPCAYCAAIDMGGRYTPLAFGLMNMMGNLGSAAFPLITPWLLAQNDSAGGGNWRLVLFCFAGMYLATAICWLGADTNQRLAPEQES
jgi:MFS family permease